MNIYGTQKRFDDHYIADVVSLDDPLKLGRLRLRIHGLFDGVAEEALPWAQLQLPLGSGVNRGYLPAFAIGDRVQVRFAHGDTRYPVIVASAHKVSGGEVTKEMEVPAIGVKGPRSTAGMRVTPDGVPTSQTGDVPYLRDEVSLQHDILIQRRANHSYRMVHLSQGSQWEMTNKGEVVTHSPQGIWFSTPESVVVKAGESSSKVQRFKLEAQDLTTLNSGRLDVSANSQLNLEAGGAAKLTGLTVQVQSLDALSMVALGSLTIVGSTGLELLGASGMNSTVAIGNYNVIAQVGEVSLKATELGASLKLSPLTGAELASPLGKLSMDLVGNAKLESPAGALEIGVAGDVELGNNLATLEIDPAGGSKWANPTASVALTVSGQVEIKNQMESLSGILRDLCTAISQITVQTGTGSSSQPVNIMAFQQIAARIQSLLGR